MKRPFRFTLAVSTLSFGLALALQPLSLSLATLTIGSSAAVAKGGEGNGGGRGGGEGGGHGGGRGGEGGRGGGEGARGGSEARGGHGGSKNDRGGSVADRGRDGARSHAAGGRDNGRGNGGDRSAPVGLVEGFLSDVRSAATGGRSRRDASPARAERSAKSREGRAAAATPVETAPKRESTEKVSLGRLNAAHAVANGNTRAAAHSAVGQLATYAAAAKAGDWDAAAAALDAMSNKELSAETVQALNDILGFGETVKADDVMAALDARRNPPDDETGEIPSGTGDTPAESPAPGKP